MKKIIKYVLLGLLLAGLIYAFFIGRKLYRAIHPTPRVADGTTSIIGFNHIGINVADMEVMLPFYLEATNYPMLKKERFENDPKVNTLCGMDSVVLEKATLQGPNMIIELTEFIHPRDTLITKMPPYGPGMTHTCYQSNQTNSSFEKFKEAGMDILTKGGRPIDLQGLGVTYSYGYDPEGNMMEMEQMSDRVITLAIGKKYAQKNPMWMTQVCIITPDIQGIIDFYEMVLGIPPYRTGTYGPSAKADSVANLEGAIMETGWFALDKQNKKLELMEYTNPQTVETSGSLPLNQLGYQFSLEVTDIQAEYHRLMSMGVTFVSAPQKMENFWEAYAHDIDGNVFSLRQAIDVGSSWSLRNWE